MKKISITLIGLIAMLMLLAAPVYAEKTSAMEQKGEKAKSSERGGMTSAGEIARHDAILASSLMDKDVQDAQGEKIGEVSDVMIGPDGNVEYIVLSQKAGFLGLGEKDLVPVPWSKVNTANIGEDQDDVTLFLSKQELENAPVFNEEGWQAFLRGEKQQEVRGYYGSEDARRSGQAQMMREKTRQEPGMKTGESNEMKKSERGAMTSAGEITRHEAILASTLMDKDVHDAQGEKIGEVSDIMIGQDGNVEYIVLSQKDGFLGFGEKDLVPVPWSKVNTANIDEDQDAVTLSLSKQELEKAPAFDEEEWKAFLQGEKQQEVRGYYGTEGDRPSGQGQMMKDKTGQKPGMKTGESNEMKKEETDSKGERKY